MNDDEQVDLDRAHLLMMSALDNEAGEAERQELAALLERQPQLAREFDRLRRLKEVTSTMTMRQPSSEVWDTYSAAVLHRAERGVAWVLVAAGAAILGGWALWEWLEHLMGDTDLPVLVRAAIVAIVVGLAILIVSVARERWYLHRKDPYAREVRR